MLSTELYEIEREGEDERDRESEVDMRSSSVIVDTEIQSSSWLISGLPDGGDSGRKHRIEGSFDRVW